MFETLRGKPIYNNYKMRCRCCNVILTPMESTMKSVSTNDYLDMCIKCYWTVEKDVPVLIRADLIDDAGMEIADYIDPSNEY